MVINPHSSRGREPPFASILQASGFQTLPCCCPHTCIPRSRTSARGGFIGAGLTDSRGSHRSGSALHQPRAPLLGSLPSVAWALGLARGTRFAPACGSGAWVPIGIISLRWLKYSTTPRVCQHFFQKNKKNFFQKSVDIRSGMWYYNPARGRDADPNSPDGSLTESRARGRLVGKYNPSSELIPAKHSAQTLKKVWMNA